MPITPLDSCPAAFAPQAAKINEIIRLLNSLRGENGIQVTVAEGNVIIRLSDSSTSSGGGGGTLPSITGGPGITVLYNSDNSITISLSLDALTVDSLDVTYGITVGTGVQIGETVFTPQTITVCTDGGPATMVVLGSSPVLI
jgi:hypothetical protein